jgi:hypothetical protein
LYAFLISFMRAICVANLILLYLIILISGEEYNLWRFSFCCFLQSPVTSFLLDSNIVLDILFSNTLSLYIS